MPRVENLPEFIKQNANYLTMKDLIEDSGWSPGSIRKTCGVLGLQPISIREQTKQFILAVYKRKSPEHIAKIVGVSELYIGRLYGELDLPFPRIKPDYFIQGGIRAVFAQLIF